jgi:hypothetical protein
MVQGSYQKYSQARTNGRRKLAPRSPIQGVIRIIGRCWHKYDIACTVAGMPRKQGVLQVDQMDGAWYIIDIWDCRHSRMNV